MIIFDLREEARLVTNLYPMGAVALPLALAALAPQSLRRRLPDALADSVRPLALVFALATGAVAWAEHDDRRQADALVERCLGGGCTLVEGHVSHVEPVRKVTSGGRFTAPTWGGYFRVGDEFYAHYPRDVFSHYSPANSLRDGDRVRVHSDGERLVLVELLD